jgi:hypothetical protein
VGDVLFGAGHPNLHGFPEAIESRALHSLVHEDSSTDKTVKRSDRKIASHGLLKK